MDRGFRTFYIVVYEISVKNCITPLRREYDFNFTTTIVVIIGRRLLDEVVYKIRHRVKANKSIVAIVEAVKVSKKIIYKLRLTLSI